MSDWLVLLAIFVVVLNPGATAQVVAGSRGIGSPGGGWASRLAVRLLPGLAIAFVVLALAALLSDRILDWLDLSLSTFQIATGVLLVFGAIQAFVGPGLGQPGGDRRPDLWLNAALLVWLISPPPLALAIASSESDGRAGTILAAAIALAVVAGGALLWTARQGARWRLVLIWGTRLLAGFTVLAAIDLIRQGVENV